VARKTVLVIDDDPSVRELHSEMLRRAGYTTVLAANGAEGLARVRLGGIDAVVTDLAMPELGGLDLLRILQREGTRVPAVIVSAGSSPGLTSANLAQALGATAVLEKPLGVSQLLAAVREALASQPASPPAARTG
jgi:CheY-like chemotaxis protein